MKAQGLSMQTIAIIIIAIIVLAGVIIFFFEYSGKTKGLIGKQVSYSGSKTNCTALQSCIYQKGIDKCSDISSNCNIPGGSCTVYAGSNECKCKDGTCS